MAESRTIYSGSAKIVEISVEDVPKWVAAKLPANDENACMLVHTVETPNGSRYDVKTELTHRELSGNLLRVFSAKVEGRSPSQMDVAIEQLVRQGLLKKPNKDTAPEAIINGYDITSAADESLIGKTVTVAVTEDVRDDGGYFPPKARFTAFVRQHGADAADRLARLAGLKPKPRPAPQAPAPAPVPAPADDEDLPF